MLRLFYFLSCLSSLANGLWMLVFPQSWYTDLPAAIPHTGAFNPHFIRDLGVVCLVAALGFGWCALHVDRCRLVHAGLTVFFAGHAAIHLADILAGRLPDAHWRIDAPAVFLPALLLLLLAVPPIRERFESPA